MRTGRLLFSAVELLIVLFFFLVGAAFLGLCVSEEMHRRLCAWLVDSRASFRFASLFVSAVAILLACCFWKMQRGSYVRLKGRGFSIDEALVRSATLEFWAQELPDEVVPSEIYVARGHVEVITSDLKCDLDEIEGRLGFFFAKRLGYERDFFITVFHR